MPELSTETLSYFLFFVVPGFVALKVYDLLVPGVPREFGNSVIELVAYSMINLGVTFWAIILLAGQADSHPWRYLFGVLAIVLLSPTLIAVGVYKFRTSNLASRWILDPIPSAWDDFFRRKVTCWVLIHLNNGKKIGGFYGKKSYASAFPNPAEVYLEEVWKVDSDGRFLHKVPRTLGMVVRYSDCDLIEFIKTEEPT